MKILFINSGRVDYQQDLLYSGLVDLLGKSSVLDYPFNLSYHLPLAAYPRNLGYRKGIGPILRADVGFSSVDCIVIGSAKKASFETYLRVANKLSKRCPVVFLDGGDLPGVGQDLQREDAASLLDEAMAIRPFDIVLKREFLSGASYEANVIPFPFSCNFQPYQLRKQLKNFDVSFWAVQSHPVRSTVFEKIKGKFDCDDNGSLPGQSFNRYKRTGKRYLRDLSRCKIVLNARGAGWDTLRFWEAPALGTFMISQKPMIEIPNPLEHGKHLIFCDDEFEGLVDLCNFYLKKEALRESIARAGYEHVLTHHSNQKRARRLLSLLFDRNLLR